MKVFDSEAEYMRHGAYVVAREHWRIARILLLAGGRDALAAFGMWLYGVTMPHAALIDRSATMPKSEPKDVN